MKKFALLLSIISLTGCQTAMSPSENAHSSIRDKKPTEPMMCTMQYDPVCGKVMHSNASFSYKTYSNACMAKNSGDNVVSYTSGECSKDLKK